MAVPTRSSVMQLGMIGLGRMGANMVRRLMRDRPHVRRLRPQSRRGDGARGGRRAGRRVARRAGREAQPAAGRLADGPGGGRGREHHRSAAAARAGRHRDRRRQLVLRRRHPAREGARREGHPLRGRGHERRRLGPRARLLHDDRRRTGGRRSTSIRSSRRSHRASATSRAPPAANAPTAPPSRATCTAGRTAPGTSSRWCTTASSTA